MRRRTCLKSLVAATAVLLEGRQAHASAGAGILPTAETMAIIEELKKTPSKYRFATFKISGNSVIPDRNYPQTESEINTVQGIAVSDAKSFEQKIWPEVIKTLNSANAPRFAVVNFAFVNKAGSATNVIVSIGYCPDKGVTSKEKLTFASTKTAFEAKSNIKKRYAANDISDLEYSKLKEFAE